VTERAVLAITAELQGPRPMIAIFARELVDTIKGKGARDGRVEVDVSASLTKAADETFHPVRVDNQASGSDALSCAICETSLLGKKVVTIDGERLICADCAAGRKKAAA
jgi:hypothetical protein